MFFRRLSGKSQWERPESKGVAEATAIRLPVPESILPDLSSAFASAGAQGSTVLEVRDQSSCRVACLLSVSLSLCGVVK